MSDKKTQLVSVSTGTILKIIAVLLAIAFLYMIRSVIGIAFAAWVLASAISPWVDKMHTKRIPRWLGVLMIYIVLLAIVSLAIYLVIPPIVHQVQQLSSTFPQVYERIVGYFDSANELSGQIFEPIKSGLDNLSKSFSNISGSVFSAVSTVFGGIVSFLAVLVMTFYMTLEEDGMKKFIKSAAPLKYQPYLISKVKRVQMKMGMWLRGQLILSLIIGVLVYIGLLIIGVDYALVLALLAAVTEFVPYVGPILGGIPAVFLALTQSPIKAAFVVVLYVVIQQLENSVISPKVMQKAVGLNPIIVILALLIGGTIGGLAGVILAIPAVTILSVFVEDFFGNKKKEELRLETDDEESQK